ncbi:uncharacterized protein H6S33_008599 [Morchella sextelata]|uniref:uncharacterized protein n=1 Tax=Morchella sextelata TaxID=1174677 RepID=UPI001D049614|nr:uncharacterized protein H6S33_008599 [Morchella sextelata]KAH0602518.1 hypothetical protein H6S33_008599 [Morchella sextelata]
MPTQYRALETMLLGKIVRLERHVLELEDEKVTVEAKFKALMLLNSRPHGHYTNKPIFRNLKVGFIIPWPKRHLQVCVRTPAPTEESHITAIKEVDDQIAVRKKEIEIIKDVFKKAKELPEERCIKALLSFIDLYKDYKEPEMACEIKPVVCIEFVALDS